MKKKKNTDDAVEQSTETSHWRNDGVAVGVDDDEQYIMMLT